MNMAGWVQEYFIVHTDGVWASKYDILDECGLPTKWVIKRGFEILAEGEYV